MKINWMSNAPWVSSGYGCQTRIFVPRIMKMGYECSITALWGLEGGVLNWNGIQVYPKGIGAWSSDIAAAHSVNAKAQILMTLFDTWPLQPENLQQFGVRWVPWFPIDHEPAPPQVVKNVAKAFDRIVFSKFGAKMMEQAELSYHYVPHGIETDVFRPMDMSASRKALGWPEDKFIIGMVAANKGQPARKALAEHLMAFAQLRQKHDDVLLYLHTSAGTHGEYGGINLPEMAENLGITKSVVYCDQYNYHLGFPDQYMVWAYNAMDVHALASMGEGFGIPIVEAQSCGCPVIVGDWTACGELCFSGWMLDKKESSKLYTQIGSYQFIPDVPALYDRMEMAYRFKGNRDYRDRARHGALAYDADKVAEKYWKPVLAKIEASIEDKTPVKLVKF
jgi:glycosyltransferase involved in cell wall biosynthesis